MKAWLLWVFLLLGGCAATPQSRLVREAMPDSLPLAVELGNTPFNPQVEYQCGPAALATVLQFQGVIVTPEELSGQIYLPERKGSLQIEIIVAARRHEMLPYVLDPQLLDLLTELASGNPVLVMQNLSFGWLPRWHYAVVIGYDINRNEILLRSGKTRRWVTPFDVFERTWARSGHWALAVVPVGEVPKTAKPSRYLEAAYAFEETGRPGLALRAYQAAAIEWPDVSNIWMALGNSAFQGQDLNGAIDAFRTATRLQPESIDGWNNLAYALHAFGCVPESRAALECGLGRSPASENLLDTRRELNAKPAGVPGGDCPQIQCY